MKGSFHTIRESPASSLSPDSTHTSASPSVINNTANPTATKESVMSPSTTGTMSLSASETAYSSVNNTQLLITTQHPVSYSSITNIIHGSTLNSSSNMPTNISASFPTAPFLSTELIIMIADAADGETMLSLRLTSEQWYAASQKHFADRYIKLLPLMITTKSMSVFSDISKHPYYASRIRTIAISPSFYHYHEWCALQMCTAGEGERQTSYNFKTFDNQEKKQEQLDKWNHQFRLFIKALESVINMQRELGNRAYILSLEMDDALEHPIGRRSAREDIVDCSKHITTSSPWLMCRSFVIHSLLAAVERDMITDLHIELWSFLNNRDQRDEAEDGCFLDGMYGEFSDFDEAATVDTCLKLRSINISLTTAVHDFDLEVVIPLLRTLPRAANLDCLVLDCGMSIVPDYYSFSKTYAIPDISKGNNHFVTFTTFPPSTRLSRLHLSNVVSDEDDYQKILGSVKQSLRYLVLENCTIQYGCWSSLLTWIMENPSLSSLRFDHMGQCGEYHDWEWGVRACYASRDTMEAVNIDDGPDNVKELLESQISLLVEWDY